MANAYDVIVVGAGPGGTTAARHLANAGFKTLLLEKEKIPRYKPCGGGITLRTRRALDVDFTPAVEDTICSASIAYRSQIHVPVPFDEPIGWSVMRDKFDALLAEAAVKAGAELRDRVAVKAITMESERVQVRTEREALHARVLVGADGANGIVARSAGLQRTRRVAAAIEAEMDFPSDVVEAWRGIWHFDFGAIPWGYGWIFPKAEHLSVGVGAFLYGKRKLNLRALLEQYIASEPRLKNPKHVSVHGHLLPVANRFAPIHVPRVALVGDAAGMVDPFTGEGIYAAIRTGAIAAQDIAQSFATGDFSLALYGQHIQEEFFADYRIGNMMANILYRAPRLLIKIFERSPRLRQASRTLAMSNMQYHRALDTKLHAPLRRLRAKEIQGSSS